MDLFQCVLPQSQSKRSSDQRAVQSETREAVDMSLHRPRRQSLPAGHYNTAPAGMRARGSRARHASGRSMSSTRSQNAGRETAASTMHFVGTVKS